MRTTRVENWRLWATKHITEYQMLIGVYFDDPLLLVILSRAVTFFARFQHLIGFSANLDHQVVQNSRKRNSIKKNFKIMSKTVIKNGETINFAVCMLACLAFVLPRDSVGGNHPIFRLNDEW